MAEDERNFQLQEQISHIPHLYPERWEQQFVAHFPWWQRPIVGYLASPLLMGLALLLANFEDMINVKPYVSGGPFSLVAIVVALLWGVGPALFAVALGLFIHAFFVLPLYGARPFDAWGDTAMYGPWLIGQLVVILIVVQREKALERALLAERETRLHDKEEANQAITQSYHQLEQLNNQLRQQNHLKDFFVSRASHELKTPITTIRGQTQLALRRITKSQFPPYELSHLCQHLEKIEAQTSRLHALINNLLDISSLQAGKIPLQLTPCNIVNICHEVIEDQRALSGRSIDFTHPDAPIIIQADNDRLTQVIINLITNAIKYSPEDSTVHVLIKKNSPHTIITVHNGGPPIPQEQKNRIFEPFYRAPQAERSSVQGWGLGLAISKEIVEQHHGQISVESSEEEGTTFSVLLP